MKINEVVDSSVPVNEMSGMGNFGRKMTGRLSKEETIQRLSIRTLQQVADNLNPRSLRQIGVEDEDLLNYFLDLKNDVVETLTTINQLQK